MAKKKDIKHSPHLRFKAWLVENNIRRDEIAGLLGIALPTLCHKINGYSHFTWPEVELICDTYGLDYAIFKTSKVA